MQGILKPSHDSLHRFLADFGFATAGESLNIVPLTGGVSSEIWRIETSKGQICVKRALPQLRVATEWKVPVERGIYEEAWLRAVAKVLPGSVPQVLAHDPTAGFLAMEFLPPDQFHSWKEDLLSGTVDTRVAASVGERIGIIHAAFAHDANAAADFSSDNIFHSVRLEPYLIATGRAHPNYRKTLIDLSDRTAATKLTLVHGDISPKNILIGPNGPVFLDAECAWFGDPAFDVAFCLNHMLLKCVILRSAMDLLLASYDALISSYLSTVDWEEKADLERRVATLLPALLLARVDGKSPVEYIESDVDKNAVRLTAMKLLAWSPPRVADIGDVWRSQLYLSSAGMGQ